MKTSFRGHSAGVIAAAFLLVQSASASADFVSIGNGDYNIVPLYRSYVFGGIDRDSDGGYGSDDIDLIDYVSNLGPTAPLQGNTSVSANGATMTGQGRTASSGFYAGRSSAQLTVTNAAAGATYYQVAGTGSATSVRFFTPSAAADHAVFTWKVSGTSSIDPVTTGAANGRLDFGASTDPNVKWLQLFDDPGNLLNSITEFGAGTYSYTLPLADLGTTINLFYWSSAYAEVKAGQAPVGSSFTLAADFFNTYVLENVQLLDTNNNPISEWALTDLYADQDVFNQNGRINDIDPPPTFPSAVPAPGTLTMLFTGLVGFGIFRRRRSH